jgi:hypothetical protein
MCQKFEEAGGVDGEDARVVVGGGGAWEDAWRDGEKRDPRWRRQREGEVGARREFGGRHTRYAA